MNNPRNPYFRKSDVVVGWNPVAAVVDVATSAADGVVDITTSVIDRIPGSEYLKDAVNVVTGPVGDFVKGPLRDFSRTTVGEVVMRAFSVAVSMTAFYLPVAIGPYVFAWVGPTLAFAAWSIPGLAKGEPFDEAMVKEFAYRVAYCVSIFSKEAGDAVAKSLGPVMSQQLTKALDHGKQVAQQYFGPNVQEALAKLGVTPQQVLENMGLTPEQMAARLNIREDVAAMALAWLRRDPKVFTKVKDWYDPKTGQNTEDDYYARKRAEYDQKLAAAKAARLNSWLQFPNPCDAYIEALAYGDTSSAKVFKDRCDVRKAQDAALMALAEKRPCDAYVEAIRMGRTVAADQLKKRCEAFKSQQAVTTFKMQMAEEASAKATRNYVLLGAGILLVAGGTAWYLHNRGK